MNTIILSVTFVAVIVVCAAAERARIPANYTHGSLSRAKTSPTTQKPVFAKKGSGHAYFLPLSMSPSKKVQRTARASTTTTKARTRKTSPKSSVFQNASGSNHNDSTGRVQLEVLTPANNNADVNFKIFLAFVGAMFVSPVISYNCYTLIKRLY